MEFIDVVTFLNVIFCSGRRFLPRLASNFPKDQKGVQAGLLGL